jgi:hypothetical protein
MPSSRLLGNKNKITETVQCFYMFCKLNPALVANNHWIKTRSETLKKVKLFTFFKTFDSEDGRGAYTG